MSTEQTPRSTVEYATRDSIAYITLDRPEAMNAFNHALIADLSSALDRVREDEGVKAVVITGSGERAFSAGADLKQLHGENMMEDAGRHLRFTATLRDLFVKVEQTPVPVIAVIRGYALAGGLELALSCDLILCSDTAQIGDQHANRLLIAGAGGTQRLPRRIGQQRALELLYTGRRLSGPEAVAYGLALRSYPPDELDAGVEELAGLLRDKSRTGLGLTKQVVQRGAELPLREALDLERLTVQEYFSCYPDATQGVTAFNESRPGH
ncbi:MAG TPA: enoyl-CoA hydratase/isomerase family protein [Nocardioides sp.]|jgi:enoyl-CoA hydratase/carnithine racemase|uniref:enoyl-CoA hydratase/isomerase family protein n=1 Tax=Nocardioides sp. TaxID=35761 RepID=UPI002E2FA6BD|nr:enoyl-CoA hydratase/isomerase family protein [Nocardioides sp.]HEX3930521.1 enoyl-CoA hydratase/isomerase family protein [Nocardioides sp.]